MKLIHVLNWIARISKIRWTVERNGIRFHRGIGQPIIRVYDIREMVSVEGEWEPWDDDRIRAMLVPGPGLFEFRDWEKHGWRSVPLYPLFIVRGSPEIHARVQHRLAGFNAAREPRSFSYDQLNYAIHHKKVTLDFDNAKLSTVLEQLQKLTGLHYVPLLEKGENPHVSLHVRDMKLSKALCWIAEISGTQWAIEEAAVQFSLGGRGEIVERFYWIGDLGAPWGYDDTVETGYDGVSPETIIQYIQDIEANSWIEPRKIEYHGGTLLVVTNVGTHHKIKDWMDRFRESVLSAPDRDFIEKANRLLDRKKVSFNFRQKTLADAAAHAAKVSGMNIVCSTRNPRWDRPITLKTGEITLRTALDYIAMEAKGSWEIRNDAVCFTGDPKIEFYPIRNLMENDGFPPETVIQYIQNIQADSWVHPNKIEYHGGQLLVVNSPGVHRQLRKLLDLMRDVRDLPVGAISTKMFTLNDVDMPESVRTIGAKRQEALEKLLSTSTLDVEYDKTPLTKVIEELSKKTGVCPVLQLDEGVDPPVTWSDKALPLKDVLNKVAQLTDMQWEASHGILRIKHRFIKCPALCFYPVKDLMEKGLTPEKIGEQITAFDPDSWVDPNKVEYHAGLMLILQSKSVHKKINDLMRKLRSKE